MYLGRRRMGCRRDGRAGQGWGSGRDGMQGRWLGWAGLELEQEGETLVVAPLVDAAGTFAGLGDAARDVELPPVVPARGGAVAGLVSHLHRDHTDAGALAAALKP